MPGQDLLKELENKALPSLLGHNALLKATKLYEIMKGKPSHANLNDIIRLAERIRISSLQEADDFYNLESSIEISPQDLVSSDFLIHEIKGWVENIREELFGAPEPPFPDDLNSALSWIETTARNDSAQNNSQAVSSGSESKQFADQQKESVPFLRRDIFVPSKNSVKSLYVQPGTLLYNLSRKIDIITGATGFARHALTVFLLTGLEPILPRVSISLNLGRVELPENYKQNNSPKKTLAKRSLKIEIHTADLSPKELKTIYDQYRRELKVRKTKSLSNEQVKLYYLVRNKGGPPQKGSKAFWQEIRAEWNSSPANKPYQSWEGVYQRYKIIERKMENLFIKQ